MTETTTSSAAFASSFPSTSAAAPPGIKPSDLVIGMDVDVISRTWAGINKPGGHATITSIHSTNEGNNNGIIDRVDVKYVLGGREKDVELLYVRRHVELTRGDRGRRGAERMNATSLGEVVYDNNNNMMGEAKKKRVEKRRGEAETSSTEDGGKKKKKKREEGGGKREKKKIDDNGRRALASIDGNNGGGGGGRVVTTAPAHVKEEEADKGTEAREEEGATMTKTKTKTTKTVVIKEDATDFVDRMMKEGKKKKAGAGVVVVVKKEKKNKTTKDESAPPPPPPTSSSSSKVNKKKDDKTSAKRRGIASGGRGGATALALAAERDLLLLSSASSSSSSSSQQQRVGPPAIRYSPNSILAVRAAHARTTTTTTTTTTTATTATSSSSSSSSSASVHPPAYSTTSIGYSPSLPPGTLSPNDRSRGRAIELGQKVAREANSQVSLMGPHPPPPLNIIAADPLMRSLYRKECDRAGKFVDYMTTTTTTTTTAAGGGGGGGGGRKSASSSPDDDDRLELKLDRERARLFNSMLSEIMFKQRMDMMDVEEMLARMKDLSESPNKPFTLLEIKPYLQKLHDGGRIFMVEDEGKNGVVYAI